MKPFLRQALEAQRFFKVICGASYRNGDFITWFSEIFTLAGAHVIDIGADPELVKAVRVGIERAQAKAKVVAPVIMVSVGINDDVHFLRVDKEISRCDHHGFCANACPHDVFVGQEIRLENCLGCDHCVVACPEDALTLVPREPLDTVDALIQQCFAAGASAIEVHTGHGDRHALDSVFKVLAPYRERIDLLACSIGAHGQSTNDLIALAHDITTLWPEPLVIQADGKPISGRKGWRSTMPALVLAQALFEADVQAFIQVSGGVNDLTRQIACREGIPIHGVATGSFARKHLGLSATTPRTPAIFEAALKKAKALVKSADAAQFHAETAKMKKVPG